MIPAKTGYKSAEHDKPEVERFFQLIRGVLPAQGVTEILPRLSRLIRGLNRLTFVSSVDDAVLVCYATGKGDKEKFLAACVVLFNNTELLRTLVQDEILFCQSELERCRKKVVISPRRGITCIRSLLIRSLAKGDPLLTTSILALLEKVQMEGHELKNLAKLCIWFAAKPESINHFNHVHQFFASKNAFALMNSQERRNLKEGVLSEARNKKFRAACASTSLH